MKETAATRRAMPTADDRQSLVNRILASPHFARSARLREFLIYVTQRSLAEPDTPIHEPAIAADVFGRSDSRGDDSIVRVHASQLRKRLEQYFQTDGADEQLIVEIPKGNYNPVFRAREPLPMELETEPLAPPSPSRRRVGWAVPTLVLLAVASAFLMWDDQRLRSDTAAGTGSNVEMFWSPFLHSPLPFNIVLADSTLSVIQDLGHMNVTLEQYGYRDYQALINAIPADGGVRKTAAMLVNRRYTSIADADIARRISLLAGPHNDRIQLVQARDFQPARLKTDHVVLLGGKRSNPWAELLENQLNFRYNYDAATEEMVIRNEKPESGEQSAYHSHESAAQSIPGGYCVVARLTNLGGKGKVLLIAGTETEATQAGGEFLLSDSSLEHLRAALALSPSEPFPDFEVLLLTTRIGGASSTSQILATRRH